MLSGSTVRRASLIKGPIPGWQKLVDLAKRDGWTAVYDPTNPETLTWNGTNVEAIADSMGNEVALAQSTEAARPVLVKGAYGAFDALEGAAGDSLEHGTNVNWSQPNHIMAVAKIASTGATQNLFDRHIASGARNRLALQSVPDFRFESGTALTGGTPDTTTVHVYSCLYQSTTSDFRIDGASVLSGDAGTNNVPRMRIGLGGSGSNPWVGQYAPLVIFDGKPADAVRDRMEVLLASLAGL